MTKSKVSNHPVAPSTFWGRVRKIGPGMLVAGAFIGTGTITTSIVAGTQNGYTLLWASVTVAVILVIILQEMSARLALTSGQPLAAMIRSRLGLWASLIAVAAIAVGNSIYSVGNLNGVVLALGGISENIPSWVWMFSVTLIYWTLLMVGKYRVLELSVTVLVAVMGIVFLVDMFFTQPDYAAVIKGLTIPNFAGSDILLVTGLIGTTVVPYNLYLHSSAVLERGWHHDPKGFLPMVRLDTFLPVLIGGLVTMAIGVVAANVLNPQFLAGTLTIEGAADMSRTLEPILGPIAYVFFSVGLFAAAISSMPMAALSAAYVTTESFGWSSNLRSTPFRIVFSLVAWIPFLIAVVLKTQPIATIIFAQAINGMLLPITAVFILVFINRKDVAGEFRNTKFVNVVGVLAVAFVTYLGIFNVVQAFQ